MVWCAHAWNLGNRRPEIQLIHCGVPVIFLKMGCERLSPTACYESSFLCAHVLRNQVKEGIVFPLWPTQIIVHNYGKSSMDTS